MIRDLNENKESKAEESIEDREIKPEIKIEGKEEVKKGREDHEERKPEEESRSFSMKFPKPHTLTRNEYLQQTINDLKERSKKKSKAIKLNQLFINKRLY